MEKKIKPLNIKNENSKIISICSGKGGVGKTFFTVNLSIALSKLGKKVLVFDGDFGLGNINVLFGFIPKQTIYNVFKGHRSLRDILFHTSDGVDVIPGASGYSQIADLNESERENLFKGFSDLPSYDYILVDTGAGINSNIISLCLASDEVLVVINPEPASITDAYGIIKTIHVNDSQKKIKLIINKIHSEVEGAKVVKRIQEISEKFLRFKPEVLGFISYEQEVEKSIKKQKPILIYSPFSKVSENIIKISKILIGDKTESNPSNNLVSFFKKRLGILKNNSLE